MDGCRRSATEDRTAFIKAIKLPAATETAFDAPVTVSVPINTSSLAHATDSLTDLVAVGFAVAHVEFKDTNGYAVQDEGFSPIDVKISILIR